MPRGLVIVMFGMIFFSSVHESSGQLTGYNLFNFQVGNAPYSEPKDLTSHFNQLNLSYRYNSLKAFIRTEHFMNRFEDRRYHQLSQYRVEFKSKGFEVKAGHFYDILGNGLLLRAYEIPGTIYENSGYRSQHGFYRDIEGFSAGYSGKIFSVKGLRGMPLINEYPPTVEKEIRRMDLVEALATDVNLAGQTAGLIFMRKNRVNDVENFGSFTIAGFLPFNLSYSAEYAQEFGKDIGFLDFQDDAKYAWYMSLNFNFWKIGGSAELKQYNNFFLGLGFNDPPTLVKEHTYKVLNRSTHVTDLYSERGYQFEMYYSADNGQVITFNTSRAVNEYSTDHVFTEYFLELFSSLGQRGTFKTFIDYSSDDLSSEDNRYAGGFILERSFSNQWSGNADIEYQFIERNTYEYQEVHNGVLILGFSKSARLKASMIWEISTDPFLTDNPNTLEVEKGVRHWFGTDFSFKYNQNHTLALFAGSRRGGPACTSGICYEVLDFTGVELRLTSKF